MNISKCLLKCYLTTARLGELAAEKGYKGASRLAEKGGCGHVSKTLDALAKSELAHAGMVEKALSAIGSGEIHE